MSREQEEEQDAPCLDLESLPFDILYDILSQVPKSSLPSARLVSKAFRKGATGLINRLRVDISTADLPFHFSNDPDPWLIHVSRLELFSSGQKLKLVLPLRFPAKLQHHNHEAYALDALLNSIQQEAHAAAVVAATKAAQRYAKTAQDARATVASAYGSVLNEPWAQAQMLIQETMSAGAAAAAAMELASQGAAAADNLTAMDDETCAIYGLATEAAVAAAEAAVASASAASHLAAFFSHSQATVAGFATRALDAAARAGHALSIAVVASRHVSSPEASGAQKAGATKALKFAFASAKQSAEAAMLYAAAAAHAGNPDAKSVADLLLLRALEESAAKSAADAQVLYRHAANASSLQGASSTQERKAGIGDVPCLPAAAAAAPVERCRCAYPFDIPGFTGLVQQWLCYWPSLREVALDVLGPTAAKSLALLLPPSFPNLRRLELRRFSADPLQKVPFWATLALLTQLRELFILGWDLEPEDQQGLPQLKQLTQLTVAHSQNNGEGLRCLSHLTNLQDLTLDTLRYDATIHSEFCGLSQLKGLSCLRFKTVGPLYDEVTSLQGLPIAVFEVSNHLEPSLPDAVERMVQSNTCLRELTLPNFELSNSLATCLMSHPHFESLSVGRIRGMSPSQALHGLKELSLHFIDWPPREDQPLALLTPHLRSLSMSQFNSMPVMDPTLPGILMAELFPPEVPPLTSLVRLKVVVPLIVPLLVTSAPNVELLEVVIPWAEAEGHSLAYAAQACIATHIGNVASTVINAQAEMDPSSPSPASAMLLLLAQHQPQALADTRACLKSVLICCADIMLLLCGPPHVQQVLRQSLPVQLTAPDNVDQPPPTFLAVLQHCLQLLQSVSEAIASFRQAVSVQPSPFQERAWERLACEVRGLQHVSEGMVHGVRPLLGACWAAISQHNFVYQPNQHQRGQLQHIIDQHQQLEQQIQQLAQQHAIMQAQVQAHEAELQHLEPDEQQQAVLQYAANSQHLMDTMEQQGNQVALLANQAELVQQQVQHLEQAAHQQQIIQQQPMVTGLALQQPLTDEEFADHAQEQNAEAEQIIPQEQEQAEAEQQLPQYQTALQQQQQAGVPGLVLHLVNVHDGWLVLEPDLAQQQQQQQQQYDALASQFQEQQQQQQVEPFAEQEQQQWQEQQQARPEEQQQQQEQEQQYALKQLVHHLQHATQQRWQEVANHSWAVQASKWAHLARVSIIDNEHSLQLDDLQAFTVLLPGVRTFLSSPESYVPQV